MGQSEWIILLYCFAIILWIIIILYLMIPLRDGFDFIIFSIPIFVFLIAIFNADKPMCQNNETWIFRNNYVTSLSILLLPLLIWMASRIDLHQSFLITIIVATIFGLMTFFDFWVSDDHFFLVKHFRSVFQTFSITLTILALKMFYFDETRRRSLGVDDKTSMRSLGVDDDDDIDI